MRPARSRPLTSLIFTRYVRALGQGIEIEPTNFEPLWDKLGDALRSEMVRRSIWSSPPSYLGIYGWPS